MSVSRAVNGFAPFLVFFAALLPAFPAGPDPAFVIRAVLTEPKPTTLSHFGNSVSLGAPGAKVGDFAGAGAVFLYSAADGSFLRRVVAPAPSTVGHFGISVAVDGRRLLVGSPGTPEGGIRGAGACFLFDAEGKIVAELSDPQPTAFAGFGRSVDIRGKLVIVGEYAANVGDADNAGKAILFEEAAK